MENTARPDDPEAVIGRVDSIDGPGSYPVVIRRDWMLVVGEMEQDGKAQRGEVCIQPAERRMVAVASATSNEKE